MVKTVKVTWKDIWGKTKEHTFQNEDDAREYIRRRKDRLDIIQESWRVSAE